MRKLFLVLFITVFILLSGVGLYLQYFAGPQIKTMIEQEGTKALKRPVRVESVGLSLWPPIGLAVRGVSMDSTRSFIGVSKIKEVLIRVDWSEVINRKVVARILIVEPYAKFEITPEYMAELGKPAAAKPGATGAAEGNPLEKVFAGQWPVGVKFDVLSGHFDVKTSEGQVVADKTNVNFSALQLLAPWTISIQSNLTVKTPMVSFDWPFDMGANLIVDPKVVRVDQMKLDLGGVALQTQGTLQLQNGMQQWIATLDIPDISKLPVPPKWLPAGTWTGGVKTHLTATKKEKWYVQGDVRLQRLSGQIQMEKQGAKLHGPFFADLDLAFSYADKIQVSRLGADVNAKDLGVEYKDLFSKPPGVPFSFQMDGTQVGNDLIIKKANFVFSQLAASAQGSLGLVPGRASQLRAVVPRVNIAGFDKFFPILKGTPLQGFLELNANVSGDLQNPKTLNLNVNPLKIENLRGAVNWQSEDRATDVRGPLSLNSRVVLIAQGEQLKSAQILADCDLTGLMVMMKDKFQKAAGQALRLKLQANQKGQVIVIQSSQLSGAPGTVLLSGSLSNPQSPNLNLKVDVKTLNLASLGQLVPMLAKYKLTGSAQGKMSLNGNFDFKKGIEASPLTLAGSVSAQIPQLVMPETPGANAGVSASEKESDKSKIAEKPEPLLPNWAIFRTSRISQQVSINRFQKGDLVANGLKWSGNLDRGILTGHATLNEVFGGRVQLNNLRINLLEPWPSTQLGVQLSGLAIEKAVAWAMPQWKDMIRGQAAGQMNMNVAFPKRPDFIAKTSANGTARIQNGYLSTLKFDQLANEKISKIPGVGNQGKLKSGGATANIDAQFDFNGQELHLQKFNVITPERNELLSKGVIRVDKTLDLEGTVYLSDPPVQGPVREANSDSSGRLILSGIKVHGQAMSPQIDIMENTVKDLLSRTATHQANKVKTQVQDQLQKRIQDEGAKKLKELFGH